MPVRPFNLAFNKSFGQHICQWMQSVVKTQHWHFRPLFSPLTIPFRDLLTMSMSTTMCVWYLKKIPSYYCCSLNIKRRNKYQRLSCTDLPSPPSKHKQNSPRHITPLPTLFFGGGDEVTPDGARYNPTVIQFLRDDWAHKQMQERWVFRFYVVMMMHIGL